MSRLVGLKKCSFCEKQVYNVAKMNPPLCAACYYRAKRNGTPAYQDRSKKKCSVVGCSEFTVAEGYCDKHYRRWKKYGDPLSEVAEKWGHAKGHPVYETWKGLNRKHLLCEEWQEFWCFANCVGERPSKTHRSYREDKTKPYGPRNFIWREQRTDITVSDRATHNARQRVYILRLGKKARGFYLKKLYGISLEQYEQMLEAQNKVCAICYKPERRIDKKTNKPYALAVDHCHKTKVVRGLLCSYCNHALGSFQDDPDLMRRAIVYLEAHQGLRDDKK